MAKRRYLIKHALAATGALWFSLGATVVMCQASDTKIDPLLDQLAKSSAETAQSIAKELRFLWRKSGSDAVDVVYQRAQNNLEQQNFTRACEHFSAAIEFAPDFVAAYLGRARCYAAQDYFGPAIADLKQALIINPNHFDALAFLGFIYERLGYLERAQQAYDLVLTIHPHHDDVIKARDRLGQLRTRTKL